MTYMISGTQAQLATALNGFAGNMALGFSPAGFLYDGGLAFEADVTLETEPTPLLVPPEMMPFNSGQPLTELSEEANFATELAAKSGPGGSRFIDVMRDLQAALTIDGKFRRGKGGHIVGCVGEVVDAADSCEKNAARAMIRELLASQNEGHAAYTKTVRTMKSWHSYALNTDTYGPLKRHALSRSIWHALIADRTLFAGRMLATLGDLYSEDPSASTENAVLNYFRSAVISLNAGTDMIDVYDALKKAVDDWGSLIGSQHPLLPRYLEAKSLAAVAKSFSHILNWGDGYRVISSYEDFAAVGAIESGNYVFAATPSGQLELRLGAAGIPHTNLQLDPDRHHAFAAGKWVYDETMGALFFDGNAPRIKIHPDQEFVETGSGIAWGDIVGSHSTGYRNMIDRLRAMGIPAHFIIGGISSK